MSGELSLWIPAAALGIGAAVRALKAGEIPLVPSQWRAPLAVGLGLAVAGLRAVAAGTPWRQALVEGVTSAALAIAGHELVIEAARGGKEL